MVIVQFSFAILYHGTYDSRSLRFFLAKREELEQNKRHRNTDHRGKNIRHQLGSAEYAMHQEHHDVLNQKIRDIRNEESQHLG